MLATLVVALLFGAALYLLTKQSSDPLDVNIPVAFAQLLFKYLPGYTPPLHIHGAGFAFDTIEVKGKLTIREEDIKTFNNAGCTGSPFLLVARTTPLVIRLLADRRCPIKPLGAVNTRNIITFLSSDWHAETLKHKDLTYTATFGSKPGIRRKRGVEFVIVIDVFSSGKKLVQMELWMLQFLPRSHKPSFTGEVQESAITGTPFSSITMSTKDPRRWAASCKDYNPIHISTVGARLFGFKSVIAHGNHVAALALLKSGVPSRPFTLELEFVRPMLLPATFKVLRDAQQDVEVLTVVSDARHKAHMRVVVKNSEKNQHDL